MLAIFGFQDVVDVVITEFEDHKNNGRSQGTLQKSTKLDSKAKFLIYQCVRACWKLYID